MEYKVTNLRVYLHSNPTFLQFQKFLLVGILNTLFGYSCFAFFLFLGLHYSLALLMATLIGILFNFKSTGKLVFGSHNNSLIYKFFVTYSITYVLNALGIKFFSHIGYSPYIGGAILIFPMAVLAFILNKRFVFNHV